MLLTALIWLGILLSAFNPAYAQASPINNQQDLVKVFAKIRADARKATNITELTRLYHQAGYLITLTYAPSWQKKFGIDVLDMRQIARREFEDTAMEINCLAKSHLLKASFDEEWGGDPD